MLRDDLSRNAYCVLGTPIDVVEMPSVLRDIETAAASSTPFFISTPNLNFLANSQSDPDFRESLLQSDLCPADGMPVVWIARLLGVPIKSRIAGADIFDSLKLCGDSAKPLKVFLFGGEKEAAAAACRALNARPSGLLCAGSLYPGFGSVEEMSCDAIIDEINASEADFLVVSLGAEKGQRWLRRNRDQLRIPVRAHLGAVINFEAAVIRRASRIVQKLGFEWLWRIKEEPYLWRRYWRDGKVLLSLVFTRVLPLALRMWWLRVRHDDEEDLIVAQTQTAESVTLSFSGPATTRHVDKAITAFRQAVATGKQIVIDFSETRAVDARFLGLLLMLRKRSGGANPVFTGLPLELRILFRLHGIESVLSRDKALDAATR